MHLVLRKITMNAVGIKTESEITNNYNFADQKVNYPDVAKAVCELHNKIVGTIIVTKGNLLGAYAKPHVPLPQQKKLTELILQAELVLSISRRNTDIFGQIRVTTCQHDILNIFIFALPNDATLAFAIEGKFGDDYDYEQLTKTVFKYLEKSVPAYKYDFA